MSLILDPSQRRVLQNPAAVRDLARWILATGDDPLAASIRRAAKMRYTLNPSTSDIQHVVDHVCGGEVSDTVLPRLIDKYLQSQ